jgi:hypothetical protein
MAIRRRLLGALIVAILATVISPLGTAPTAAATDRLPNLRMGGITDARITTTSTGRRLLKLSTYLLNAGPGPVELRGSRASTSQSTMAVRQWIRRSDGTWRSQATTARTFYAGDGHDHWHIAQVQDMALLRSDGRWIRGAKIGFCFFDTGRYLPTTPGSPTSAGYFEASCGRRAALTSRMGISVGWGDKYQWSLAYQWIDITGVGGGTYLIRTSVDPLGQILETSDTDNCGWATVRFATGGSIVTVLSQGKECIVAGTGGTTGSGGWSASADAPASLVAALGTAPPAADQALLASVDGAGVAAAEVAAPGAPVTVLATGPPPPASTLVATTEPASGAAAGFRCAIPLA